MFLDIHHGNALNMKWTFILVNSKILDIKVKKKNFVSGKKSKVSGKITLKSVEVIMFFLML